MIIFVCYVPPRYEKTNLLKNYTELESLAKLKLPIVVVRDINIDIHTKVILQHSYPNTIEANGFQILDGSATRVCDNTETCIDHVITKDVIDPNVDVLDQQWFSDHFPLLIKFKSNQNFAINNNEYRDMSFLTNI